MRGLANIGDRVWLDTNGDGVQDAGEPGVSGVVVNLYDESGVLIATTTTDNTGAYSFDNLAPGTYVAEFVAPPDLLFTAPDTGDDAQDSDAASDGFTPPITLGPADSDLSIDAGLAEPPRYDFAIVKTLADPLTSEGEATWVITVTNLGPAVPDVPVTVTDELPDGLEFVSASAPGWTCSTTGQLLTCTHGGTIEVDDPQTIAVVTDVTADPGTEIQNVAVLAGLPGELSDANNVGAASGVVSQVEEILPKTGRNIGSFSRSALVMMLLGLALLAGGRTATGRRRRTSTGD